MGTQYLLIQVGIAGLCWFGCMVFSWLFSDRLAPFVRLVAMSVVSVLWVFVTMPMYMRHVAFRAPATVGAILPWWIGTTVGTIIEMKRRKKSGEPKIEPYPSGRADAPTGSG